MSTARPRASSYVATRAKDETNPFPPIDLRKEPDPETLRLALLQWYICYDPLHLDAVPKMLVKFSALGRQALLETRKRFGQLPIPGEALNCVRICPRTRLAVFYAHYAPEKLHSIDKILERAVGHLPKLWEALLDKYGPEVLPQNLFLNWKEDASLAGLKGREDMHRHGSAVDIPQSAINREGGGDLSSGSPSQPRADSFVFATDHIENKHQVWHRDPEQRLRDLGRRDSDGSLSTGSASFAMFSPVDGADSRRSTLFDATGAEVDVSDDPTPMSPNDVMSVLRAIQVDPNRLCPATGGHVALSASRANSMAHRLQWPSASLQPLTATTEGEISLLESPISPQQPLFPRGGGGGGFSVQLPAALLAAKGGATQPSAAAAETSSLARPLPLSSEFVVDPAKSTTPLSDANSSSNGAAAAAAASGIPPDLLSASGSFAASPFGNNGSMQQSPRRRRLVSFTEGPTKTVPVHNPVVGSAGAPTSPRSVLVTSGSFIGSTSPRAVPTKSEGQEVPDLKGSILLSKPFVFTPPALDPAARSSSSNPAATQPPLLMPPSVAATSRSMNDRPSFATSIGGASGGVAGGSSYAAQRGRRPSPLLLDVDDDDGPPLELIVRPRKIDVADLMKL